MQNDLMNAVTRRLDELFDGIYPVYTESVEQGLELPCFFVGFLKTSDKPLLLTRRQRTWDMRIQFIPEEHGEHSELLNDVCEELLTGLEWITLSDGRPVRGLGLEGSIVDGVLTFQVSFSRTLIREKGAEDKMETLNVKGTVK